MEYASCTEQLWGMTATIQAPWIPAGDNQTSGCRVREAELKNIELNRELGVLLLQMHIAREDLENSRAERAELHCKLEDEARGSRALLQELHDKGRALQDSLIELALLRSEREEQERLAVEIWGPLNRRQPDATWDPPPVLLYSRPSNEPLSICTVAADLGFKHGAQQIHGLGAHVREAFMSVHGRAPEPRVFFNKDGTADRVGCFTEGDRDFLAAVVRRHGEPDVD
jgi:hypothetical protein